MCTVTFFQLCWPVSRSSLFLHSRFLSVKEASRDLSAAISCLSSLSPAGHQMAEPCSSTLRFPQKTGKMVAKELKKPSSVHLLVPFVFGDRERQKHSPFDFLIETRSQNQLKSAPELERYNKTHTNIKSRH